ncbi:MAG: hypothetical protein KAR20_05635 [Candidatus Heimdallarchaeota archaeon]|nr:hypothetical protein [Candidatus Heimdallarchaeota archaeon]
MNVKELQEKLSLEAVTNVFDNEITGVFISDMVSDIISGAKAGNLLVTVQIHKNLIAAANLVDLAGIIITQNKKPDDEVKEMAERTHIPLFSVSVNGWEIAKKLFTLGIG